MATVVRPARGKQTRRAADGASCPGRGSARCGALLRAFRRSRDGSTAVEFAMVSGPLIALTMAIFETSFVFLGTQGLETAVSNASRLVMTGQAQFVSTVKTSAEFRDAYICNASGGGSSLPPFMDCSKLVVDVRTASSFGATNLSGSITAETAKYCTGGPGAIVVVRAVYPMPVYFPILKLTGFFVSGANTTGQVAVDGVMSRMLMGASAFRNEPFPNTPPPVAGC